MPLVPLSYMRRRPFPSGKGVNPAKAVKSNRITDMTKQFIKATAGAVLALALMTTGYAQDLKGRASAMPAYYDHTLFTIQFVEFPAGAEQTLLMHNGSLNFIYQSDPGLPGGQPFVSVIDEIPTDGFNPIWEEVQITFTPGNTPRQLFSDDEVAAAVNAGEITLTLTGEVYWCPVVGPGANH